VALGRVWLEAWQARRDPVALQKAIEALERAAGTEDSSEALTLLGRALLLADQPERGAAALTDAVSKKPTDPVAFAYLADATERTGHLSAALGALLDYQALEGDPKDPRRRAQFFYRIADLSLRTGTPLQAVDWFERATAADAGVADAVFLVRFAEAQSQAGNVTGARENLRKALALDPGNRAARVLFRRLAQIK
jgi:predicted Zn-dependent protease